MAVTAPTTLNFTLTRAGVAALFNAAGTGVNAIFATVAVGTGVANGGNGLGYTPTGLEVALKNQFLAANLGAGSKPSFNQLMFGVTLDGAQSGWINEIGLFLADGTLFALWSEDPAVVQYTTPGGVNVYGAPLGFKSPGVPYVLGALITIQGAPLSALTLQINGPIVNITLIAPPNCGKPADPVTEAGEAAVIGLTRAASDAEFAAGAAAAASNFKYPFPTLEQTRVFLRPPPRTDFYVDPAGNDNNPGTLAFPFKTKQAAVNYVSQFQSSVPITIHCAVGTWTIPAGQNWVCRVPPSLISSWVFVGQGVGVSIIDASATGGHGILIDAGVSATITGFTIKSYYNGVWCSGSVTLGTLAFVLSGTIAVGIAMYTAAALQNIANATWTFSGAGAACITCWTGSMQIGYHDVNGTIPITINVAAVTVYQGVVYGNFGGTPHFDPATVTWVGTPTGMRFYITAGAHLDLGGAGVNWIPGTVAGTIDSAKFATVS